MAPRQLAPGTVLSGRYQLAELIGESDISAVYAAADQRGQAQVALKVFDSAVMARAAALSEYQSQARQASGLGVEGIARAYDFGIDANTGVPFSTAERIGWASLDRRVLAQGPLGVADMSRALSVLARALDAAHAAGLCHRDLKPQNVFISPQNPEWVRITDFGMSAVRRGAAEAMGWGGPPGYTPPDAVDASAPPSPGIDLFALGVVTFFALTRATPFRSLRSPGFDPNGHWSELNQSLHPLSERAKEIGVALDPAFDAWFARALAINPQERFRSAGEMAREMALLAERATARGAGGPRTMPGIAAAIAQPLVFQPEPSAASLGLAATAPAQHSPMMAMSAASAPPMAGTPSGSPPGAQTSPMTAQPAPLTAPASPYAGQSSASATQGSPFVADAGAGPIVTSPPAAPTLISGAEDPIAGLPKKGPPLALFVGAGILLLGGLAFGAHALLSGEKPKPSPLPSASPEPSVPAASPPAVATAPARAHFTCKPQACEWLVCDGKNVSGINDEIEFAPGSHECSASRNGFGSNAQTFVATPGQVTEVVFSLPPLPAEIAAKAAAAKPTPKALATAEKVAAPASKTPAAKTTATKPSATKSTATKPKKKCSTFLGCK